MLKPNEEAPLNCVDINATSRSTGWGRGLSPFIITGGPTWTGDYAQNVENLYQFSKCYKCHVDSNGDPTEEYFKWAKAGWASKTAMRYPMGKGAVPLYSYWNKKKYDYLEAKEKLYIRMYFRSVRLTDAYKRLEALYQDCKVKNIDLVLRDFDAYNHIKLNMTPHDVMRSPNKKFGHGFVLMFMLLDLLDDKGNMKKEKSIF